MSVEKESLKRFLFIYIFSTFLLLGIGGYYYYKVSYQSLINQKILSIKKDIEKFIEVNRNKFIIKDGIKPNYLLKPLAIYVNKVYLKGNITLKDINLSKEYYIKGDKLYLIHKEHKIWGDVYLVTYRYIKKDLDKLLKNMILFFIFSSFFIIIVAYVLGKIFLKPMKQAIDDLENFITDATHEINTPISNILINIELLKELNTELKESDELKKVESSAFRISKIFKDLSFLRLNHKTTKNIQNISLDKLLNDRLDFFATMIKNKNLQLKKEINPLNIKVDKEDMIRVIDNLLSNSIKYSHNNYQIKVILKNNSLVIVNSGNIKDTKKIMQKFIRENKDEGGFGIGLYIVKKILDFYGFNFNIKSKENKIYVKIIF
jgi:two-component system OmpR family sensor kinase